MNAGKALKNGFNTIMKQMGGPVLIHKNYGTTDQTTNEVIGLKNSKEKDPSHIMFQFNSALDISQGDVLQQKGSRTVWHVLDIDEKIVSGEFIYFEAHVQKNPISLEKAKPAATEITYNVSGQHARVNVNSTDNSVNISNETSQAIFEELRSLINDNIKNQEERNALLSQSDELEASVGTHTFMEKYQEFMAKAANHMTVLAPIMPTLSNLLS